MPIVELPNGTKAEFPDNMSHDDIIKVIKSHLSENSEQPQRKQTSATQEIARPFLRAAKSAATGYLGGAAELANLAANMPGYLGNMGARAIEKNIYGDNIIPEYKGIQGTRPGQASQTVRNVFDKTTDGLTANRNKLEENLQPFEEFVGGGGLQAIGAVTNLAKNVGTKGINAVSKIQDVFRGKTAQELGQTELNPQTAKLSLKELQNAPENKPTTGLDVQNPEFQQFAKSVISAYPQSKQIALDFAKGRNEQAINRISKDLSNLSPVENAFKSIENIEQERIALSEPLYKKAYSENLGPILKKGDKAVLGSLKELLKDDRIDNALSKARIDYGISKEIPDQSVAALHGARQVIDDIISTAKNADEKNKVRSYMELKNKLNKVLYEASPTLKQADAIYADKSKLITANKEGQEFNNFHPEDLKKKFGKFSPAEKDSFRIGARQNIQDSVENAVKTEGTSIPDKIQINKIIDSEGKKKALKQIFPTSQEYNKFLNGMEQEVLYNKTIKALGLDKAAVEEKPIPFLKSMFGSLASVASFGLGKTQTAVNAAKAGEAILIKHYKGLNEKNAKEIANILINKEASIKYLQNVINKADATQKPIIKQFINDIVATNPKDLNQTIFAGTAAYNNQQEQTQ
jgi:hypothetical protein